MTTSTAVPAPTRCDANVAACLSAIATAVVGNPGGPDSLTSAPLAKPAAIGRAPVASVPNPGNEIVNVCARVLFAYDECHVNGAEPVIRMIVTEPSRRVVTETICGTKT